MTYKQIETSREIRLWIAQIVVPAVGAVLLVETNPALKQQIKTKYSQAKDYLKSKRGR